MTVHEIETTLQSLYKRHESLDEATLLVLLKAGGWETKMIHEAIAVHRTLHRISADGSNGKDEGEKLLPKIQEKPLLPEEVDAKHLLEEHYPEIVPRKEDGRVGHVEDSAEPQSLIAESEEITTSAPVVSSVSHDLPHNLPIKPFDTTPHIWSFEYYKRIFFGDESKEEVIEKKEVATKVVQEPPRHVQVLAEHKDQTGPVHHIHVEPVPLDRDDEKLVLLAGVMLVTILLLLAYMYSRGRL